MLAAGLMTNLALKHRDYDLGQIYKRCMRIARLPKMLRAELMTDYVLDHSNYNLCQIKDIWKSQGTEECLEQD